ncbi:MAG TPA: tRNA 2-thiocytidine biosynthesis TtcA family protein [Bacillota bacterium]|nr:tRNA 2-thiocytidine biosynthesis TtcA family protein [Bacillota bacterium]
MKIRLTLPHTFTQKILRAIREFDLIRPGDRVLVGFSGGKDSAFLLYALSIFEKHRIIPFKLGALTVDLGFENEFDLAALQRYCDRLEVPFISVKTEIAKYALGGANPEGPCATCSFLRRGTMNRVAGEHGYNVIALAHHQDDAVETFLMSTIFSGQIKTFLPRTELERSGITVIRPLVYFREAELRQAQDLIGFTPVASPCPLDGKTKRAEVKELIRNLSRHDPRIFNNLAAAMREGRPIELWPAELPREKRKVK